MQKKTMMSSQADNSVKREPRWIENTNDAGVASVVALMCPNSIFSFIGSCKITVLQGAIDINGFHFLSDNEEKDELEVVSSKFGPSCTVTALPFEASNTTRKLESTVLNEARALASDTSERVRNISVVRLCVWTPDVVEFISSVNRQFGNLFLDDTEQNGKPQNLSSLTVVDPGDVNVKPFTVSNSWHKPLKELSKLMSKVEKADKKQKKPKLKSKSDVPVAPTLAIVGGKASGKSTFSQWIVNRLLDDYETVAYLDCDLGQSEFTPCGQVSLHFLSEPVFGTSFIHLRQPTAARFIGSHSPTEAPTEYLHAIFDLFNDYLAGCDTDVCPLIINTQGWVKGLGYLLLLDTLRFVSPSIIVQIDSKNESKNLPDMQIRCEEAFLKQPTTQNLFDKPVTTIRRPEEPKVYKLASLADAAEGSLSKTNAVEAKDLRTLSLLSYFSKIVCDEQSDRTSDRWVPISHQHPYAVPWSSVSVLFPLIPVSDSNALRALNASIVALLRPVKHSRMNDSTTDDNISHTLDCIGYGIIRAIDTDLGVFYINSPLPPLFLKQVTHISKGLIEVPQAIMMQGTVGTCTYMTYDFSSGTVAGGKGRKTRTNLVRKRKAAN